MQRISADNGDRFNIKIAFAWASRRELTESGSSLPEPDGRLCRTRLACRAFQSEVATCKTRRQGRARPVSARLLSQITRGRAVILKDCLLQTDVFNLAMRRALPLFLRSGARISATIREHPISLSAVSDKRHLEIPKLHSRTFHIEIKL